MAFQIHDFEEFDIAVSAVDAEGNDPGGTTAFTSSDETVAGIRANEDGTTTIVASPGEGGLGTATITATYTNPDGSTLEGSLEVEVIAGDAVAVNLMPGEIRSKS